MKRGNRSPEARASGNPPTDPSIQEEASREQVLELRQEQLVAQRQWHEIGEAVIRTEVVEVPGRLEVDALTEEVSVEHRPVGQVVTERRSPWQEDDVLVVPVYEEQLVVSKRLVMKEELRIRRVGVTERHVFEDTLRREQLKIEGDPRLVHEHLQSGAEPGPSDARSGGDEDGHGPGLLDQIVRKIAE